jgi:serine acetyltransferase/glycosyltransferase involved in cell wall biosynthesis
VTTNGIAPEPVLSVVIATYNREQSIANLLAALGRQTLPPETFEVIVVDDGSEASPVERLRAIDTPYHLTVLRQVNAGPAAARHTGIESARGQIVVIVDDDMAVGDAFLSDHLALHPPETRRVVLGRVAAVPGVELRLFERFQISVFDKLATEVAAKRARLVGSNLYTGNVSLRRADYLRVGGFDKSLRLSEDAELGIRLEADGVEFEFSNRAVAWHESDHTSLRGWMQRSFEYGKADARVSQKHSGLAYASPWRFLFQINPLSRLLVFASILSPGLVRAISPAVMKVSLGLARLGWERAAIAGTTLVYGLQYYAGVRAQVGARRDVLRTVAEFLNKANEATLPASGKLAKLFSDIHADRRAIHTADSKYRSGSTDAGFWSDYIQKIGFQIMVAYRFMHLYHTLGLGLLAKMTSRFIRHAYAADIHWEAFLSPGVMIVHGMGLAISRSARVGSECILFQGVTLGESIHPHTRAVGAPTVENGVHVGAGATLLGPITIGARSKIAAGCVLMTSVPPFSLVENPEPIIRTRTALAGGSPDPSPVDGAKAHQTEAQKNL